MILGRGTSPPTDLPSEVAPGRQKWGGEGRTDPRIPPRLRASLRQVRRPVACTGGDTGRASRRGRGISPVLARACLGKVELYKNIGKFGRFGARRFKATNRKFSVGKKHAWIATEEGVKMVGDYEQRLSGATPAGKLACFECGSTNRLRGECPIYLAKAEKYRNTIGNGIKFRRGENLRGGEGSEWKNKGVWGKGH